MSELTFWDWDYHVSRKWRLPPDATAQELWIAHVMATFGTNGKGIYPSAEELARHSGLSIRSVKTYRKRAIDHGLFVERPGEFRRGIPVLDIAIPADAPVQNLVPLGTAPVQNLVPLGTAPVQNLVPLGTAPVQNLVPPRAADCTVPVQQAAPKPSNSSNEPSEPKASDHVCDEWCRCKLARVLVTPDGRTVPLCPRCKLPPDSDGGHVCKANARKSKDDYIA